MYLKWIVNAKLLKQNIKNNNTLDLICSKQIKKTEKNDSFGLFHFTPNNPDMATCSFLISIF